MSADMEDLLREGMERFTADVRAPAGLARTAGRLRRRRLIRRGTAATAAAALAGTAVLAGLAAAGSAPGEGGGLAQARAAAYVVSRVKTALAAEHQVFHGVTMSTGDQPSATWGYGSMGRFEEFTGTACGHVTASGDCTRSGGSERYLAQGTAVVGGKLTEAYVTYFDHKYSLSPVGPPGRPASACSPKARLSMGGPPDPTAHWSAFISATLACGAATVTGHVRIDGVETTRITGKPATVRLSPGYGHSVRERYARARWTLYVNPVTYLPVRMIGITETFGGSGGHTRFMSTTDVQWLPPTRANIARAMVIIPPGYQRVSSPAGQ